MLSLAPSALAQGVDHANDADPAQLRAAPALPLLAPASLSDAADPPQLSTVAAPSELEPRRPEIGDLVIAIESIECRDDGSANVLLLVGPAVDVAADMTAMKLVKRFAARYSPAEAGVDSSDWWCVPRRRYCYGEVAFSDWRGTHRAGERLELSSVDAYHIDWGAERTLRSAVGRQCGR